MTLPFKKRKLLFLSLGVYTFNHSERFYIVPIVLIWLPL